MTKLSVVVLTLTLSLAACGGAKERSVPDLKDVEAKLAFACAYEKDHLPALNPEADQLYRYARWLRKNQIEKEDPLRYPEMERFYRIATAYGHYKANLDLRDMIGKGTAKSDDPVKETLDLTQELIDHGIPGGYYDMGRYLKAGYGVKQDEELANRYYRKAADLGNPEAQYLVGDKLTSLTIAQPGLFAIGNQMKKCAAEQGHGKAALEYGSQLKFEQKFNEAIKYMQLGTKWGDETAAAELEAGFGQITDKNRQADDLGVAQDDERHRRYKIIANVLSDYSYARPSVPELDDIVPLPPAKLPPWDGKLKWMEDFKANIAPPKPSEALMEQLAKAKGLDPKTGRRLSSQS
ncbi:SEL1-like repeat protein [Chromobacterium sp. CV08]|uniref:SEL1-like repeat protein n=1 Tax=Chromobacterium sp. CV08 TaxID=3133274 RepID=UPI003DAA36F7